MEDESLSSVDSGEGSGDDYQDVGRGYKENFRAARPNRFADDIEALSTGDELSDAASDQDGVVDEIMDVGDQENADMEDEAQMEQEEEQDCDDVDSGNGSDVATRPPQKKRGNLGGARAGSGRGNKNARVSGAGGGRGRGLTTGLPVGDAGRGRAGRGARGQGGRGRGGRGRGIEVVQATNDPEARIVPPVSDSGFVWHHVLPSELLAQANARSKAKILTSGSPVGFENCVSYSDYVFKFLSREFFEQMYVQKSCVCSDLFFLSLTRFDLINLCFDCGSGCVGRSSLIG